MLELSDSFIHFDFVTIILAVVTIFRLLLCGYHCSETYLTDPSLNKHCLFHAGADRKLPPWRAETLACLLTVSCFNSCS